MVISIIIWVNLPNNNTDSNKNFTKGPSLPLKQKKKKTILIRDVELTASIVRIAPLLWPHRRQNEITAGKSHP